MYLVFDVYSIIEFSSARRVVNSLGCELGCEKVFPGEMQIARSPIEKTLLRYFTLIRFSFVRKKL